MRVAVRCLLTILVILPAACSSREPDDKPSRVLLISVDTLRRDHLGVRYFQTALAIRPNHPAARTQLQAALAAERRAE